MHIRFSGLGPRRGLRSKRTRCIKNTVAPERIRNPVALWVRKTRRRPSGKALHALSESEKHGGARASERSNRTRSSKSTAAPERDCIPCVLDARKTLRRPSGKAPHAHPRREKYGGARASGSLVFSEFVRKSGLGPPRKENRPKLNFFLLKTTVLESPKILEKACLLHR